MGGLAGKARKLGQEKENVKRDCGGVFLGFPGELDL